MSDENGEKRYDCKNFSKVEKLKREERVLSSKGSKKKKRSMKRKQG